MYLFSLFSTSKEYIFPNPSWLLPMSRQQQQITLSLISCETQKAYWMKEHGIYERSHCHSLSWFSDLITEFTVIQYGSTEQKNNNSLSLSCPPSPQVRNLLISSCQKSFVMLKKHVEQDWYIIVFRYHTIALFVMYKVPSVTLLLNQSVIMQCKVSQQKNTLMFSNRFVCHSILQMYLCITASCMYWNGIGYNSYFDHN